MAMTYRDMSCPLREVSRVLGNGWLFGLWVVGSSRIRDVDDTWPAAGARIHHSFGVWPLLVDDTTECLVWETDRRMELRARGWPAGEADVLITLEPRGDGCRVTIEEDAVRGPGTLVPRPARAALLRWRNTESLRRLEYLAAGHAPTAGPGRPEEPTAPGSTAGQDTP